MIKQITVRWLRQHSACIDGIIFVKAQKSKETFAILEVLKNHDFDFCNWLLTRLMTGGQCVKYAKYSAGLAIQWAENARLRVTCAKNAARRTANDNLCAEDAAKWIEWGKWVSYSQGDKILDYGIKLLREKT